MLVSCLYDTNAQASVDAIRLRDFRSILGYLSPVLRIVSPIYLSSKDISTEEKPMWSFDTEIAQVMSIRILLMFFQDDSSVSSYPKFIQPSTRPIRTESRPSLYYPSFLRTPEPAKRGRITP